MDLGVLGQTDGRTDGRTSDCAGRDACSVQIDSDDDAGPAAGQYSVSTTSLPSFCVCCFFGIEAVLVTEVGKVCYSFDWRQTLDSTGQL